MSHALRQASPFAAWQGSLPAGFAEVLQRFSTEGTPSCHLPTGLVQGFAFPLFCVLPDHPGVSTGGLLAQCCGYHTAVQD
jgi:hypothetical protein